MRQSSAGKITLFSAPFDSIDRPHIALSLLRGSLQQQGHPSDVVYTNLHFANVIGPANYRLVAERYPTSLLLGDAIFSRCTFGRPVDWESLLDSALFDVDTLGQQHRSSLLRNLPLLADAADQWVSDFTASDRWSGVELAGFSNTFNLLPSIAIARNLRRNWPRIKIVFGGGLCDGALAASIGEAFPEIDFICQGEGEVLFPLLVSGLRAGGSDFSHIAGLVWRTSSGMLVANQGRAEEADLAKQAAIDYSDWDAVRPTLIDDGGREVAYPIESSRGCWFGQKSHCTFCGLNGAGLKSRSKSGTQVLLEILSLRDKGAKRLFCVDNIMPHEFFEDLLPFLAAEQPTPQLFYEIKSNLTYDQCKALRNARVLAVQPGIESLSTPILKLMRKGTTAFQNVRLLRYAAELGISVNWNFLYGFPMEDPKEYQRQSELVSLIGHLQPPVGPPSRVRIDRFSPLFFSASTLGVNDLVPAPAYKCIYPIGSEQIANLAMFFRFAGDYVGDPDDYIKPVRSQVLEWLKLCGSTVCVALEHADHVEIYDNRFTDGNEIRLEGPSASVFKKCRHGITQSAMDTFRLECGMSRQQLETIITDLTTQGLVINIDGRLLSLPLQRLAEDFATIPRALQLPLFVTQTKAAMTKLMQQQDEFLLGAKILSVKELA
ncbi:RiPP maturation radical SAM C-methyltransferase [Agrobacterium burrii]|uniref:RiPP maturation radical SAM C-methyltransferase n=1 Tax=Agrobacterium burrii TaxID=2815339 RepID=A0ABS3ERM6_9HYPH|nr:RiPP maturation radical SAM C-methyltransferase [Agrobacterium burrii]MBO0134620.1 RiPP maturation radical SAM C-methyltransferase [Agrobacterium burrii]